MCVGATVMRCVATCWVVLAQIWEWSNVSQQHPTCRSTVAKRTQHVAQPQFLNSLRQRANARNVSFQISLWWPIHIINPVDKTRLPCYTSHRRSTTVLLKTYPSIQCCHVLCWHVARFKLLPRLCFFFFNFPKFWLEMALKSNLTQ